MSCPSGVRTKDTVITFPVCPVSPSMVLVKLVVKTPLLAVSNVVWVSPGYPAVVWAPLPRVAAVIWSRPLMVLAVTAATPTALFPGLVFWLPSASYDNPAVDPFREVSSSIALYPWLVVFVTPLRTAVLLVRLPSLSYAYAQEALVAPALVFSVAVISRFRVSYP